MIRVVFILILIMQVKLSYSTKRSTGTTTLTVWSVKPSNRTDGLLRLTKTTIPVTYTTSSISGLASFAPKTTRSQDIQRGRETGRTNLYQGIVKKGKNILKSIIPFTEAPHSISYLDEKSEPNVKKSISHKNQAEIDKTNPTTKECYKQTPKGNTKPSNMVNPKHKLTSVRPIVPKFVYNSQIYGPIHETDTELETYKDPYYTEDIVPLRLTSDTSGSKHITYLSSKYGSDPDNPVFGDQAFFSFILNDYFDRNIEDEPKLMEDVGWGKEFDKELTSKRDAKRVRRLETNFTASSTESLKTENDGKSIREAEQIVNNLKANPNIKFSEIHKEFKTFADMFAYKFGSNNDNTTVSLRKREESKLNKTLLQEKDELQEASELLVALVANYNSESKIEENGTENVLTTLSEFEQFLNAHETRPDVKEIKGYKDASNILSRLRHVAKNVALVNNADYIDTLENMLYKK